MQNDYLLYGLEDYVDEPEVMVYDYNGVKIKFVYDEFIQEFVQAE